MAAGLRAESLAARFKAGEVLRPAVEAWKKMAPAERECAAKLHKPGCTSHAVNLTTEASHNKTEKQVIEENMVRARAARIITPTGGSTG